MNLLCISYIIVNFWSRWLSMVAGMTQFNLLLLLTNSRCQLLKKSRGIWKVRLQ